MKPIESLRRIRVSSLAAPFLLLCGVAYVAWPLRETTPLSHDHPVHIFKAWHMWTQLLPTWRLRGFSHFWAFGFPSDEFVPPGEELWVGLFHELSFGRLSWLRAYAWSMAGLLLVVAIAMYRFTKQYFGAAAALFAGLFMVWDVGGWAQGGWDWLMLFGAWPMTLGATCILTTLVSFEKLLARGGAGSVLIATGWVAASFLGHQLTIVLLPLLTLLLLADHYWRGASNGERRWLVLAACALGVSLSAFYLLPMMARADQTCDFGVVGPSREEMGSRLLDLMPFKGAWIGYVALGAVGAVHALKRRMPGAFLLTFGAALLLWMSSSHAERVLHIERLAPNYHKVEVERMLFGAKLLWLPLAGHALTLPFAGWSEIASELAKNPLNALRSRVLVRQHWALLALVFLLPFMTPALQRYKATYVDKEIIPEKKIDYFEDLQKLWEWSAKERAATQEHYRIAYDLPFHDHLSTLAPVFDGTAIYKLGFTPTQIFWTFPMEGGAQFYRLLSVKYLVTLQDLGDGGEYSLVHSFGKLRVYRFSGFDPRPFSVLGNARVELREFTPERLRLQVSDAAGGARVKLHVSRSDHWRARLNGHDVPIAPATSFGFEYPFLMEVAVENGELVLDYVPRAPDWLGRCLTFSALPIFAMGVWLTRRKPSWLRLPRGARRSAFVLIGAGALGAIWLAAERYRSRSLLVPKQSLFREVPDGALRVGDERCTLVEPFTWQCGRLAWVQAGVVSGGYGSHICLSAPFGTPLRLEVRRKLGSFIVGRYDPIAYGGTIDVSIDGQPLGHVDARPPVYSQQFLQFDTRELRAQKAEATIGLRLEGSALHCFDFGVAD